VTQAELDRVAAQVNGRPRETLGWMTPAERLAEVFAETSVTD
jgi:transposase, IS30 family